MISYDLLMLLNHQFSDNTHTASTAGQQASFQPAVSLKSSKPLRARSTHQKANPSEIRKNTASWAESVGNQGRSRSNRRTRTATLQPPCDANSGRKNAAGFLSACADTTLKAPT